MLCCAGHLASLLLFALLSVSSLFLVGGSHQDQVLVYSELLLLNPRFADAIQMVHQLVAFLGGGGVIKLLIG